MNEKDVFISYKAEELNEAMWVRDRLEEQGISCWLAPGSIPGGSSYAVQIPRAIRECVAFVLILSNNAQESKWVPRELDQAINANKVILPFSIENCQLKDEFSFYLSNVQRYDAWQNREKAFSSMVRVIKALIKERDEARAEEERAAAATPRITTGIPRLEKITDPYLQHEGDPLRYRKTTDAGYKLLDVQFCVDEDQTVEPIIDLGTLTDDEDEKPEIRTTAVAKDTGTHVTQASKETTIIDTVSYTGLKPGKEYVMKGVLMVADTGKKLVVNGKEVTAQKKFTPKKADGTVEMEFKFDSSALAGKSLVVFEDLYRNNVKVTSHADLKDKGQTVKITKPEEPSEPGSPTTPTTSTPSKTGTPTGTSQTSAPVKTGDNSRMLRHLLVFLLAGITAALAAFYRKRG